MKFQFSREKKTLFTNSAASLPRILRPAAGNEIANLASTNWSLMIHEDRSIMFWLGESIRIEFPFLEANPEPLKPFFCMQI